MAWVRTSFSMISFGFTMVKFFEYLDSSRGPTVGLFGRTWTPSAVGLGLMTIGIFALVAAVFQHRHELRSLRTEGLQPGWSLALTVATVTAVLGLFGMGTIALGA
jgi:putative membrane protein